MSTPTLESNKRAFLFLRNMGTLIDLGYPLPTLENLQSPTESYVASLELFKKSKSISTKKTEEQAWKILSKLNPEFSKYELRHIFCHAIQSDSGSKEDAEQVFSCLQESQGVNLKQAYAGLYAYQLLEWMQNEVTFLPLESTVFLLRVWQSFNNFTILETNTWEELLSLPNWSSSQKKVISNFKLKHDFLNKNNTYLQDIKLQSTGLRKPSLSIKKKKENHKQYLNQYLLLLKSMQFLFQEEARREVTNLKKQSENLKKTLGPLEEILIPLFNIASSKHEEFSKEKSFFKTDSWEYHFLNSTKKISYKIFAWRAKKMLPLYQKGIKDIASNLSSTAEFLAPIMQNQKKLLLTLEHGSEKFLACQAMEKQFKNQCDYVKGFEKDASNLELLGQKILHSFIEEQTEEPTQDQIALIEKNQRELIEEEEKFIASQSALKESSPELLDSEEEEVLPTSLEQSPTLSFDLLVESNVLDKIDISLKNLQIDGILSKAIDRALKQLKTYLLEIDTLHELRVFQKEQAYEIHAHLVLATAAIEQIIQTIQDQRWDQVVLGFRSAFIHCHFAVEQMLSLSILLKKKETTATHNLICLAEKLGIHITEEKTAFLKDIAMHLWFCYPEDYRSFYPEKSYPKPFIFLQKLFDPYKAKGKLDVDVLKEAIQLCFTRYNQTIEFILDVSLAPKESLGGFLEKTKSVQQEILAKVVEGKKSNDFIETAILQKCNQAIEILSPLSASHFLLDFKGKELLQKPLNTIKEYLQLMKISLESSQQPTVHSLQQFLQIETLANMDKLFKHLFRTIILLQTEEDNHSHNLSELFYLVKDFYTDDVVKEQHRINLKEINLSITHHYLHKNSSALLQKRYKKFFETAYRLAPYAKEDSISTGKKDIHYKELEEQKEKIHKEIELSFDLFIKLLRPVVSELEQLSTFS